MIRRPHFLNPLLQPDTPSHILRVERSGVPLAWSLEPAFDAASRRIGLLGRATMADDTAMIIAPCSSVHTFFMKFTIDVAFVDRDGIVLKRYRSLGPWRVAFALGAFAAVELVAGRLDRSGVRTGDRLLIDPVS